MMCDSNLKLESFWQARTWRLDTTCSQFLVRSNSRGSSHAKKKNESLWALVRSNRHDVYRSSVTFSHDFASNPHASFCELHSLLLGKNRSLSSSASLVNEMHPASIGAAIIKTLIIAARSISVTSQPCYKFFQSCFQVPFNLNIDAQYVAEYSVS